MGGKHQAGDKHIQVLCWLYHETAVSSWASYSASLGLSLFIDRMNVLSYITLKNISALISVLTNLREQYSGLHNSLCMEKEKKEKELKF